MRAWIDQFVDAWNNSDELLQAAANDFRVAVLAFVDDLVLASNSVASAQIMLNELVVHFEALGLRLNVEKCKWLCDRHVKDSEVHRALKLNGLEIDKVRQLKVLGSIVTDDCFERQVVDHRISCAWSCYNKWKHVLESRASLDARLCFFNKTVAKSMLWCLETTRYDGDLDSRLNCAHRRMVRRMMRLKRHPNEKWLDWHKRSFSRAKQAVDREHH